MIQKNSIKNTDILNIRFDVEVYCEQIIIWLEYYDKQSKIGYAHPHLCKIELDKKYKIIGLRNNAGIFFIYQNYKYYYRYKNNIKQQIYVNITDSIKYYKLLGGYFKYNMKNKWKSRFISEIDDINILEVWDRNNYFKRLAEDAKDN
jgi:hypothetical protein